MGLCIVFWRSELNLEGNLRKTFELHEDHDNKVPECFQALQYCQTKVKGKLIDQKHNMDVWDSAYILLQKHSTMLMLAPIRLF